MKIPTLLIAATALCACSQTAPAPVEETTLTPLEAIDIASADATCAHGALGADRSFVLCEDGALRRTGVETALAAPVDDKLDIGAIAKRYNRASQDFTGIEVATYGGILPTDRQPVAATPEPSPKADTETVVIGDTVFDIYTLDGDEDGESGVIFIERRASR